MGSDVTAASALLLVATGSVGASIVQHIFGKLLDHFLVKSGKKQDKRAESTAQIKAIIRAQRAVMHDRIKYLGLRYTQDGVVDFDDRRALHEMHDAYHDLGGNGALDVLMRGVDSLPLKAG